MSKARNIADLLDANGDVVSSALDNVPPSNDASALTTGTIDNARISLDANEIPALDTSKITTGTLSADRIDNNSLSNVTALPFSAGIDWQSVQTTGFTAVAGNGYPCNTTSAGFTVTLPATPSAGDQVQLVDYAGTFDTNALVINPNGEDIEGGTANLALSGERTGVIFTYIDSSQGWIATSGINEGTDALSLAPFLLDFLVVGGGGGGGNGVSSLIVGGGGGAGGYRNSYSTESSGGGSSSETSLSFTIGETYTITVGAGGSNDANGNNSSISGAGITTITSIGGGSGSGVSTADVAGNGGSGGGSGGGGGNPGNFGTGTANQGFNGGDSSEDATGDYHSGGGGGASEAGNTDENASGGDGLSSSITGSAVTRGGGGGGSVADTTLGYACTGGDGGGGNGSQNNGSVTNGSANTGSGGGGNYQSSTNVTGASGGSGVVILRMPDGNYSGTTTGSPTVTTGVGGTDTVLVFTASGSYTAQEIYMAHFAKLGTGNIVERVEVVSNDIATTEQAGVDFLNNLYKTRDVWKQTSYNATIRKNFASIGFTYDQYKDAFIEPKPFPSWTLNETTCRWEAPLVKPDDDQNYRWNETIKNWELVE